MSEALNQNDIVSFPDKTGNLLFEVVSIERDESGIKAYQLKEISKKVADKKLALLAKANGPR